MTGLQALRLHPCGADEGKDALARALKRPQLVCLPQIKVHVSQGCRVCRCREGMEKLARELEYGIQRTYRKCVPS